MKVLVSAFAILFLVKSSTNAQSLKTTQDSINYAVGMVTAEDLKHRIKDWDGLNKEAMTAAFDGAINGKPALIPYEDARKMIRRLEKDLAIKAGATNKAEGEAFLAENGKRKEVMTTVSGLQYEVIAKGSGTVLPVDTSYVRVNYHGTLLDGRVFDSSVDRGKPAEFAVSRLVPGFKEALKMMHTGDKFKIYIPQNLAYGERGTPSQQGSVGIKPYSMIMFELELLDILDPSKMPASKPRPAPQMNPAQGPGMPGQPMPGQPKPVDMKPKN